MGKGVTVQVQIPKVLQTPTQKEEDAYNQLRRLWTNLVPLGKNS